MHNTTTSINIYTPAHTKNNPHMDINMYIKTNTNTHAHTHTPASTNVHKYTYHFIKIHIRFSRIHVLIY